MDEARESCLGVGPCVRGQEEADGGTGIEANPDRVQQLSVRVRI